MSGYDLTDADRAAWRPYLHPEERLVWIGGPAGHRPLGLFDVFFFVTGAVMLIGSAELHVLPWGKIAEGPAALPFVGFSLIWLAFVLYFMVGRIVHERWMTGRTMYALTDWRALIARRGLRRSLQAFWLPAPAAITLEPGSPGSVFFAERVNHGPRGQRQVQRLGFERIMDAAMVHQRMRRLARDAAA